MSLLKISEEYEVILEKDLSTSIGKGTKCKLLEIKRSLEGKWFATVKANETVLILPLQFFEKET